MEMAHKLFAVRPVLKKNVFTLDIFYKYICIRSFKINKFNAMAKIPIFRPSFCPVSNCFWYTDGDNGERQSSHVLVFCVNFERHICAHITTSIKCYLHSLRYVHVPITNISCQSNWHLYIWTCFYKCKQTFNVTKLSKKEVPGLQKQFSLTIYVLQTGNSYIDITRTFKSNCNDFW